MYCIFSDDHENFMPVNETLIVKKYLSKNEVISVKESDFFTEKINEINPEDCVIIWISIKNKDYKSVFKELDCRKFLKIIDVSSSDFIPFRHEKSDLESGIYEAVLMTYPSKEYLQILDSMGQKYIKWPHSIEFNNEDYANSSKDFDIIISGQLCRKSYLVRTKVAETLLQHSEQHGINTGFLPHPGYKINERRHRYIGEDYVSLLSKCRLVLSCGLQRDIMVMKYLESAKAYSLPVGEIPSYMPEEAKSAMLEIKPSDSKSEILEKIKGLLNDEKYLREATLKYHNSIKLNLDIETTTVNMLNKIINRKYDSLDS